MHARHLRLRALLLPLIVLAMLGGAVGFGPLTAHASGVTYNVGDVFAGTSGGNILHLSPSGAVLDTLNTSHNSFGTGMAFDASGNLYATDFNANAVTKFDSAGNLISDVGSGYNADNESIVQACTVCSGANAGHFYVGQADGSHRVLEFNSSFASVASFSPAVENRGTDWVDLAADQCTLYYTSEGAHIKRFNVCTSTQLADFNSTALAGPNAYAFRILPNQDVLVADATAVYLLDTSGSVIQTYTPGAFTATNPLFALNLGPDLKSFWTASEGSGDVYRIDIASGSVLTHFNAGTDVNGLTVFGEDTAAQPKLELTPSSASQTVGTSITMQAQLVNVVNPAGIVVTFTVTGPNAQTGTGVADASGVATFTYTGNNPGTDTVVATASSTTPPASLTSNSASIIWTQVSTTLTYTGATSGDFNDVATVSARLTDSSSVPLAGQTVTFTVQGTETCSAVTDTSGIASCSLTPGEPAGAYSLVASFAGTAKYVASSTTVTFTVTHEETTTTYTGPTLIANGGPVTLSAVLAEDGTTAIPGRSETLTLGTGVSAQACSGTTNIAGSASCTIASVSQPLGPGTVAANFFGDAFYSASSASANTIVYAFAQGGSFVVGNQVNTSTGKPVLFWGSQWQQNNPLSGGSAPNSFKGFEDDATHPVCGTSWLTDPGNSTPPPATVPSYMAVIVSSSIAKLGSAISGDVVHVIIVKVNPGYGPQPSSTGTGTVVAQIC
ncbi:MAG: Ig-like domain repeat protein [Candidatus Dormibacteria bacterium]